MYGKPFDPVSFNGLSEENVKVNTIFTGPGLVLVGVGWSWAVALKLVRYDKFDPHDIASILRLGRIQLNIKWTPAVIEQWLVNACNPMGYAYHTREQREANRQKMRHAIYLAEQQDIPPRTRHTSSSGPSFQRQHDVYAPQSRRVVYAPQP